MTDRPHTAPKTNALACLSVLAAQVSINVGAAFGKGLFAEVGPEGVAALRTSIAALILLAISRPWRRGLSRSQLTAVGLYGLALGGMNLLIYLAIARIPIGIAVAIEICGPLAVALIGARSAKDLVWLVLAVGGLLLLVPWPGADATLDLLGVACALAAATCWALYILLGKRALSVNGVEAVAMGMVVACVITVPIGVTQAGAGLLAPSALAVGIAVAALSSALPYVLEMRALRRLPSRVFGMISSSAPAIAALAGFFVLREQLSAVQWTAILLMMSASAGAAMSAPLGRVGP